MKVPKQSVLGVEVTVTAPSGWPGAIFGTSDSAAGIDTDKAGTFGTIRRAFTS